MESTDVLGLLKLVYVIYSAAVMSALGAFAFRLARPARRETPERVFVYGLYGLVTFLVAVGVGIHVLTFQKIPWVKWDLNRDRVEADREIRVEMADYSFRLPEEGLKIGQGEMVRFDVRSSDYTYGFGVFRQNGTMVFQMQVVPGRRNDLVWRFDTAGVYSIRSTEYSGPRGGHLVARAAVVVAPVPEVVRTADNSI